MSLSEFTKRLERGDVEMVKIVNKFGDEYKGRQGRAVYQGFYGKQVRRLWDGPKRNTAPQQEEQKKRFRIGLSFWASLTGEQKRFLREYVSTHYSGLTAQQWAVKVALSRPRAVLQAEQVKANLVEWKEGWDAIGWPYRQTVNITNNMSDDLTDYQQEIDLTADSVGDNFRWDLKGADLRFYTEDGQEVPHWVESWDEQNKTATVWVKVPHIQANGSINLRMYYGNEDAQDTSDPARVFDFYDDFNTDNLTKTDLENTSSTDVSIHDSILEWIKHSDGYTIFTWNKAINYPAIIEYRWKGTQAGSKGEIWGGIALLNNDLGSGTWIDTNYRLGARYVSGSSLNDIKLCYDKTHPPYGEWINVRVTLLGDGTIKWEWADKSYQCSIDAKYFDTEKVLGIIGPYYADTNYQMDWIRVRKYASSEPSASLGQEEQGVTYTGGVKTIYVKAVEHVALKKIELYDSNGQLIGTYDDLSNLNEQRITTIWRIPDDVADSTVRAVVYSLAGTVDQVNF